MIEPTDREFAHELRTLKERLSAMAARAADQIALAMEALTAQDDALARQVIDGDHLIDADENEIDKLAMHILMSRHPLASDLRFVTMALKFVVDVERIGDLAAGIAKRALELNRLSSLDGRVDLTRLATLVQRNLHLAIESFVQGNLDEAQVVINADAEIDRLNSSLFAELIANVAADPATVTRVLPLTSVSRYLERIGDHVKNLAEEVIFMVSATDVRHLGRTPSN
ncbi:MAG TPA: phosphate signaling complex protein PhoU [Polyangia bacterium]|jgi:phosphate transport system protein|nr:phosphate signaling complex protein PhoU [Polyangia bacterium]